MNRELNKYIIFLEKLIDISSSGEHFDNKINETLKGKKFFNLKNQNDLLYF